MADEKDRGFKISDHRKFNPDGTPRDNKLEAETAESQPTLKTSSDSGDQSVAKVLTFPAESAKKKEPSEGIPPGAQSVQPKPHGQSGADAGPTANPAFDELVNMLTVEAVMHLGLIENPMSGQPTVDLEAAKHMIDLLGMLQNKTLGNLTVDEGLLIDNVLADLRMQFVGASKGR